MKMGFRLDAATPEGTIENAGDIQANVLALPDFSLAAPMPVPASAPAVAPFFLASAPAPLTQVMSFTSAAGVAEARGAFIDASGAGVFIGSAGSFAPLAIHATFGSSILNKVSTVADPSTALQIENAINTAINFFQTGFTTNVPTSIANTVTVNLTFDYGFLNGNALTNASGAAKNQSSAFGFSYGTVQALLPALLPASNPTGNGAFFLPTAQMKILGLSANGITPTSSGTDGFVGINTIANGVTMAYDPNNQAINGQIGAIGAIEHEISEVLGRIAVLGAITNAGTPFYSIMDMFRYSAPNTRALTAGATDYFSLNNGVTNLGAFNNAANGGDAGDWAASVPNDAFNAFLVTGQAGTISTLDIQSISVGGLTATCFREGTLIQTIMGGKPVESVAVGDILPTLLGGPGRVIWAGRRVMDLTRHPDPALAWPVRVQAGAFAPKMPLRDLWLSPDHAVHADGVLIPVKHLINGTTIAQVKTDRVVYHHIELEQHDVILAEGLPAETYLDAGDRATFAGGAVIALYPDFAARRWEMKGCAAMVLTGPVLEGVRRRLAARAAMQAAA